MHPSIHPLIKERWSPRAMSGDPISDEDFLALMEAARWAPSSYNNQPWRFIYGKKGTKAWDMLFDVLVDKNKLWCKNSAVLVLMLSKKTFDFNDKPSYTHSFDAGAAWENLALEGSHRHLVVHGMEGFDYKKARSTFKIPDNFQIEAMIAIGKRGPIDQLDASLQPTEKRKDRKPLKELISEGSFNFK